MTQKGLLKSAIRDNDPVILWNLSRCMVIRWKFLKKNITSQLSIDIKKKEGKDVTLVSFGKIVKLAIQAAGI